MKNFKIKDLWLKKQKQPVTKTKPIRLSQFENEYVKDESWDMSPEAALRVAYSGHK